jgi:hypothetical protein
MPRKIKLFSLERHTTKRFGTYFIFDEAVSTLSASCSSSINRLFNELACPLFDTISSLFAYCSVVSIPLLGGVIDFLN